MNALCYRTVFSKRHGTLVAVGEHANSQGKANGAHGAISPGAEPFGLARSMSRFLGVLTASFALVTLAWAQPALNALPKGGQVAQGAVQFSQSAQQLQITQSSDRAAVNWQSFDIGAAAKVNVVQPSAQAVLLNRVGGTAPSQIFGQLQANGKVILVNPNGMVFGQDGSVSAAAFTASTLNISDADFMAGNERYTRDGATGAIVNRGLIQAAPGGYVALLGASVSNEGQIVAPQGNVYMAAADAVTLPVSAVAMPMGSSGRIRLELTPSSINAAVANQKGGTIVTGGGQVYLQAAALNQAMASVLQSGSIDTTGEQGGAVHVLADGGRVRVDGHIKANSTNGTAGGDIYIGRDKDTNVLAAVGDVSGAQLESKGGFVETSGVYLATDGVSVKAAEWLLDPSDITISTSASSHVTGTSPGDITPNGGTGTSSIVQVSTIQNSIIAGTNVTIKTTNSSNITGAGNITIVDALTFTNNTADATLSLIADNGITQNAAISATGSKLVNISMEAKGNYQGSTAPSTNSDGININAGISTNGNITLKGSTTKDGNEGVYIGGVTLKAKNIDITGTATGAATVPENAKGIRSFGTLIATDKITLIGTSTNVTGVGLEGGSVKAGGAVVIDGNTTNGKFQGTNIGADVQGASVTIEGNSRDNFGVAIGNGKTVKSTVDNVVITGTSTFSDGIRVGGASSPSGAVIIAAKNIKLDGDGVTGGVRTLGQSLLTAGTRGVGGVPGDITIIGDATTGNGVIFQQFVSSARLNASNNIDVRGTVTGGAGSGSGVQTLSSETNGQSVMFNAGGTFTLTGINLQATNTNTAIQGNDGMQVTAGGDIAIIADRKTSSGNAIYFHSQTNGIGGNASFKSTNGDVLIQANQGGIIFENAMSPTYTTGTYTSLTDISGRNITIDNTGGGVSTVTGKFEAGTGTSTANGINLASTAGIKMIATQNINLSGNSTGAAGVLLGGPITVKAAGDVNIQGKTTSAGAVQGVFLSGTSSVEGKNVDIEGTAFNGNGVLSYADINATSGGSATITGTSTGTGGSASALSLWAKVTADQNVNLKGENTHTGNTPAAVFTNKAITATNGKIDVTAITKGTSFNALQLHDGGSLTAKTEINLKADTLSISNAATINAGAGTGKVTITTDSANANINIGAADVGSTTTSARTLGLTNAELNQISAGKTVIGDLANTGKITVGTNSETSSAASNGNVVLQTKGDIEIANKLTIASGKTLTLNAGGSVTDNDTNGIIKADKLELLGDGSFNLDNKKQNVGTLAANVKSLVFTNETALKVDTVNGTTGVTAKEGVRVTTEKGDLTINKAITNTASGNVVVGAGVSEAAGSTVQGDVKTTSGQAITTQAGGKTLVYTGSAAGSGLLSHLNTALGDLKVTGDATQNTDTNFAFNNGVGISGSTETAQVMFREKVTITNGLVGTTVGKTYGDAETKNDASAKAALLVETIAKLKQEGGNLGTLTGTSANYTTPAPTSGNVIKIAKSVIIDSLTGNLDGAAYSGAQYLKANGTYAYNTASNKLTSTKYTLVDGTFTDAVKVNVAQKALTGSIVTGNTIYGDNLVAGAVTLNKVGTDDVSATGVTITTTGKTSGSGKLKAGTHTGNQSVMGLTGNDAVNYTFANVKGDYEVEKKALTGSIAQGNSIYGDPLVAGAVSLTNKVGADDVSVISTDVSFNTTGKTSGSGKLKADTHADVQSVSSLTGADKDNYTFADVKGSYKVDLKALTGSISDVTTVYGTSAAVGVVSFNGLSGDKLTPTQTVVLTGQAFSTSNNLKAGTYTQSVGAGVGGDDAGNYTFAGTSSSNYLVNRLNLATQIADVSTTYGTAAATGAASITGQIIGDEVSLSGVASLVNSAFSSSNRLRVGAYQQTVGAALGGVDAGNYTAAPTTLANYVVTPKVILASVTAADKVYDGNTAAALLATSVDILAGDTVNVTGLTGNFASKNVARDGAGNVVAQAVTLTGSVAGLGGADGANYVLGNAASVPATSARITPRGLIVSGITAADKVYDGNTAAVVSVANAALANVVIGDNVGVGTQNAQGNFADKNVARGADGQVLAKAVLVSGLQLQGTDAGNYSLSNDASTQARITPRTVSLSGNTAQDKVVDGNATAQVRAGSLTGLVSGESLNVNGQGEFEDALVGSNKVVNARFNLANGSNGLASNYDLANTTAALRASILSFLPASVDPASGLPTGARPTASRTRFSGASGAGAATGVNDEPVNIEVTEQCSVLNPELCECEDTKILGVEMCFAPTKVVSLKD